MKVSLPTYRVLLPAANNMVDYFLQSVFARLSKADA
jgi:hypothetical protein